ncbi:unnamed protein product [Phyllotreta striolata]|uniref:Carboxylic ester hydrolase n=1 Tax=Phyllotreta striolata TaxID=444603 RepID=A0A9N9TWV0_PHYSR|nr:unnamed protein product [Phyllotreta striolata]
MLSLHLILGFVGVALTEGVIVEITNGKIEGYTRVSPNNVKFNAFQGIPYAKPPTGKLRFLAPVPHDNWPGVLETKKDGNRCFSVAKDTDDESEDCLFINVYTPVLNLNPIENATLPVMVYIYGGGFRDGASQYDFYGPDYLIEQQVVMVSLNYRVGPFGFLSTGDGTVPGNAGLKDQRLGLEWVQRNIRRFGGDPSRVIVFGQSAGAASVGLHILSKGSAGLFRGAIGESGSGISNWAYLPDPIRYPYELISLINKSIELNTSQAILDYLQTVPAKEIDVASTKTHTVNHPLPVIEVEHDGAFLTEKFYEILDRGDINRVPLMIGCNSEEYLALSKNMDSLRSRAASYDKDLRKLVPKSMNIIDENKRVEIGRKIKEFYLDDGKSFADNPGYAIAYNSESHFINPIIKHAEMQSKFTDVYLYKFSYGGVMGKNLNVTLPGVEKCTHSEELFYTFKRILPDYDNSDLSQFPPKDVLTHKRMVKLWTNFAKNLNPTPVEDAVLEDIIWPKLTPNDFQYLNIDEELTVQTDIKHGRYRKWMDLFAKEALPPYVVV